VGRPGKLYRYQQKTVGIKPLLLFILTAPLACMAIT
jgi:hypothetical protein